MRSNEEFLISICLKTAIRLSGFPDIDLNFYSFIASAPVDKLAACRSSKLQAARFRIVPANSSAGFLDRGGMHMSQAAIEVQARSEGVVHANDAITENRQSSGILAAARARAVEAGLPYAGSVSPSEAWELFTQGDARLIDVRSAEELKFVGRVPDAQHVAWMSGISLSRNPRFVRELGGKVGKDEVVLLLCRSGKRSAAAAEAAAKAGFQNVFNILEGFEGDLDEWQRRGGFNGWRFSGLPWVQD